MSPLQAHRLTGNDLPSTTPDGRQMRSEQTRATILLACRDLIMGGDWRPSMHRIAKKAHCSVRTVFERFSTVDELYGEALDHLAVRHTIVHQVVGAGFEMLTEQQRVAIARAVVLGRVT